MDKRLLAPDFLANNLEYVQKQASEEGLKLIQKSSNVPGIGITYEVQEIEDGV